MNLRDKLRNTSDDAPAEAAAPDVVVEQAVPKARKVKAAPAEKAPPKAASALPKLDVNRRFLMIAGAAALMTALMGVMYLNNAGSGLAEGGTKLKVYTPKDDIVAGTRLTEDNTTTAEIPKAYLPKGAITELDKLKDHVAIAPMVAGEPIIEARISAPDAKYGIAYLLKPGERAKTITVDSASGLAGLIKPGNEIDLHATVPDPSDDGRLIGTPVLQKCRVIAVGSHLLGEVPKTDEEAAKESSSGISSENTVTLAVPGDKVSLVTLMETKGNLKMVLRATGDASLAKSQFTEDVLMSLLGGKVPPKPVVAAKPKPAPAVVAAKPHPVAHTVIHYDPPPRPAPVHHDPPPPKPKPAPVHHDPPAPKPVVAKPVPVHVAPPVVHHDPAPVHQPEVIRFGGGGN
ncbi:MAG: Flp pilus assembly CpaB [Cyanobacteria bacterium RYN_339]|nr:Flp pilus assembly CpaB [Cyanobacteria bacterium RYN_339]